MDNFDPESFDQDIYIRVLKGRGRGRSFEELGRRSALHDPPVISAIKPRLLDLVELLLSNGLLTWQEIEVAVGPVPPSDGQDLEDLETHVENIADDLGDTAGVSLEANVAPIEKLQSAADAIKEEYQACLESIEGAAAEIFKIVDVQDDIEDEDPDGKLQRALNMLREDYSVMEAETGEGESKED